MNQTARFSQKGFSPIIIIVSLLLIILVGVGFWFYTKTNPNTSNIKEQKTYSGPAEKIRVGNVGEYTIFNLIAKEKELFSKNGLDAEVKEFTSGPASIKGLLDGETDINIAADFVGVRNIFDHPELRILAQVNQHRVFSLAAKKSRISAPADLKGKKIGLTKKSAAEYFLGQFLNDNNITLSDITMVDLTPADMLTQMDEDKIDAIVVFEPHIYKLKNKLGENFISWNVQGDQNISALVFSTQSYIEKNPQIIERYLKSLVEAENYYQANQSEVKDFIGKKLNYDKSYIDYSWPKFTHSITLNQELLLNMESEANWVIKNGLTTQKTLPNYLDFISFTALKKVKPAGITLIH